MQRVLIGKGFYQSGHGRGFNKTANVYLINGKLYAKSKRNWEDDFRQLEGELEGYVRINEIEGGGSTIFCQVSGDHKDFVANKEEIEVIKVYVVTEDEKYYIEVIAKDGKIYKHNSWYTDGAKILGVADKVYSRGTISPLNYSEVK